MGAEGQVQRAPAEPVTEEADHGYGDEAQEETVHDGVGAHGLVGKQDGGEVAHQERLDKPGVAGLAEAQAKGNEE
ncbi:hypothetical protein [Arthrobacter sp. SLBN-83]|uniref:hypothetical protein n=1 Tax=Arthrobacter sp. SLBN-83 TaxID=2768449 RepID=UPI001F286C50|nr:hypothetical protein [Arthrobacter sp. SLBN-83]